MADRQSQSRFKQMQFYLMIALIAAFVLFILYLIVAGNAIIWLKVILAVLIFIISLGILALQYLTKELLRRRSLWVSLGAAAIALCLLFSLILNFPCPNPRKVPKNEPEAAVQMIDDSIL